MTDPETRAIPVDVAVTIRFCEERAAGYGALRKSSLTAIALDRAATALETLAAENAQLRDLEANYAMLIEQTREDLAVGDVGKAIVRLRQAPLVARAALSPVTQVKEPRP